MLDVKDEIDMEVCGLRSLFGIIFVWNHLYSGYSYNVILEFYIFYVRLVLVYSLTTLSFKGKSNSVGFNVKPYIKMGMYRLC